MTYFSRKKAMRERMRMVMRMALKETTNSSKTKNIARKSLFRARKGYDLLISNQNPPLPFSSSPPLVSSRLDSISSSSSSSLCKLSWVRPNLARFF